MLTQTQIACFLIASLLLVVLLTLLRGKLQLSFPLFTLFPPSIVIANEDWIFFLSFLKCYRLFKMRVCLIDSCITNGVSVSFFFFFTLIASRHLCVLSLFPLSLFDSLCGNECDVATLSVACLIFSLSPIFFRCTFKSAVSV